MSISLIAYKFATVKLMAATSLILSNLRYMVKLLLHILFMSTLGVVASTANAQTCRVNIGTTSSGTVNYIEVYEYDYVSEKPTFPGGDRNLMTFINATRNYPLDAYRKGIQGRVTCSFIVNTDGSISHISVLRGVNPSLNREAIRILSKMPEWIPGKHDGKVVPVRVVHSVPFRK